MGGQFCRHGGIRHGLQLQGLGGRQNVNLIVVAAHHPTCNAAVLTDIIGDNPVTFFARQFFAGIIFNIIGLRRKADDQLRALAGMALQCRQNVWVLDQFQIVQP